MANIAPAAQKYRKVMKGRIRGVAKRGNRLAFGDFGIQSLERGPLYATELEAARWLTYRAASLRDAGQPFQKEAAMAKLKASRVAAGSSPASTPRCRRWAP